MTLVGMHRKPLPMACPGKKSTKSIG